MNLYAKPMKYKTYIQDKDAAFKEAAIEAKSMITVELQAALTTLLEQRDQRTEEEGSIIDAQLAGKIQAFNAELLRHQPDKPLTSQEIERMQR